ncbi:MAG: LysM peptidoglycan-binding domain-containing protein [Ferruginibacter sp.]
MKKVFFILCFLPLAVLAQKDYKLHTVGAKESLSSIGRLYNINGRELANYNHIDYEKGLSIGQVLKIPVKQDGNTDVFTPPPPAKTAEPVKPVTAAKNNAPLYHTVEKKQTLYAISKLYGITVADIKQWNNLTADGVSEGARIIVGYGTNGKVAAPVTAAVPDKPKTEVTQPKKDESPRLQAYDELKQDPPPVVKKETAPAAKPVAGNFSGGVFRADFDAQAKTNHIITENGPAGVFKSNSGWQDGKYYCLHNMAAPGTIVKLINNANGKSVYAKVLDMIPDIKQNAGLVICISNAAADVLGITGEKTDCTLNYSK